MEVVYDAATDVLTVELKPGPVAESDEDKPGVILDYDEQGNLIGVEVLDASRRVADVRSMEFQVSG
jgi:YD repeat-containing protein